MSIDNEMQANRIASFYCYREWYIFAWKTEANEILLKGIELEWIWLFANSCASWLLETISTQVSLYTLTSKNKQRSSQAKRCVQKYHNNCIPLMPNWINCLSKIVCCIIAFPFLNRLLFVLNYLTIVSF